MTGSEARELIRTRGIIMATLHVALGTASVLLHIAGLFVCCLLGLAFRNFLLRLLTTLGQEEAKAWPAALRRFGYKVAAYIGLMLWACGGFSLAIGLPCLLSFWVFPDMRDVLMGLTALMVPPLFVVYFNIKKGQMQHGD